MFLEMGVFFRNVGVFRSMGAIFYQGVKVIVSMQFNNCHVQNIGQLLPLNRQFVYSNTQNRVGGMHANVQLVIPFNGVFPNIKDLQAKEPNAAVLCHLLSNSTLGIINDVVFFSHCCEVWG